MKSKKGCKPELAKVIEIAPYIEARELRELIMMSLMPMKANLAARFSRRQEMEANPAVVIPFPKRSAA